MHICILKFELIVEIIIICFCNDRLFWQNRRFFRLRRRRKCSKTPFSVTDFKESFFRKFHLILISPANNEFGEENARPITGIVHTFQGLKYRAAKILKLMCLFEISLNKCYRKYKKEFLHFSYNIKN